jgi:2-polyprenyl-3-methyl-5-hydroxy-6-metoxy-1,4-benzoquinol methylase
MITDFSYRSTLPEKMDDPSVPVTEVFKALKELEIINHWLGGYNVVLSALNNLPWSEEPLTIMDLGCGGGDMLRHVAEWGSANHRDVRLIGVDINPAMIEFAKKRSDYLPNVKYMVNSVWDDVLLEQKPDIVINSLFCHHFDDNELVNLVSRMTRIAQGHVIINDLHRHWFAYHSIKTLTQLFSRTYLVKYDGPLSVARALTRNEWVRIMEKAGVKKYSIDWMWAWRWKIMIEAGK